MRIPWIIQAGPKGNHKCSCMRKAEADLTTDRGEQHATKKEGLQPCDHEQRSASQSPAPAGAWNRFFPGLPQENNPTDTLSSAQ